MKGINILAITHLLVGATSIGGCLRRRDTVDRALLQPRCVSRVLFLSVGDKCRDEAGADGARRISAAEIERQALRIGQLEFRRNGAVGCNPGGFNLHHQAGPHEGDDSRGRRRRLAGVS